MRHRQSDAGCGQSQRACLSTRTTEATHRRARKRWRRSRLRGRETRYHEGRQVSLRCKAQGTGRHRAGATDLDRVVVPPVLTADNGVSRPIRRRLAYSAAPPAGAPRRPPSVVSRGSRGHAVSERRHAGRPPTAKPPVATMLRPNNAGLAETLVGLGDTHNTHPSAQNPIQQDPRCAAIVLIIVENTLPHRAIPSRDPAIKPLD